MTAPDPRLDAIQARLGAATPGPWGCVEDTYRSVPMLRIGSHVSGSDVAQVIMHATQDTADATFIANAPADVAFLLAEIRKAREALADAWDIGVMHGHNANGRLIDKRNENPYAAVAAANGDGQ